MNTIIVTGSKIGTMNHLMLTYQHVKEKNLCLNGFVVNQNVSDGYETSNLKQQIIDLTGHTVYGTIPYQKQFKIESYVKNFSNFIDVSAAIILASLSVPIFTVMVPPGAGPDA